MKKELILRLNSSGPTEHANNPLINTDIAKKPFNDPRNDFYEIWMIFIVFYVQKLTSVPIFIKIEAF